MFVLVRHAHAGSKKTWPGPDVDRPVSATGREQVAGLTPRLAAMGVTRLVSSPFLRCRQTLAPLAEVTGLVIDESGLLAPDADPAALALLLSGPDSDQTVFCTHGETLAALFDHWAHGNALGRRKPPMTPKGGAWVVTAGRAGVRLRYLAVRRVGGRS